MLGDQKFADDFLVLQLSHKSFGSGWVIHAPQDSERERRE